MMLGMCPIGYDARYVSCYMCTRMSAYEWHGRVTKIRASRRLTIDRWVDEMDKGTNAFDTWGGMTHYVMS